MGDTSYRIKRTALSLPRSPPGMTRVGSGQAPEWIDGVSESPARDLGPDLVDIGADGASRSPPPGASAFSGRGGERPKGDRTWAAD